MRNVFVLILMILFSLHSIAQSSDFIVLKKKNNRTLRTYFPGSYLSGSTYDGFNLHGIIKQIRNDSIFFEQMNVRQVPTQFGTPILDTLFYTLALHYTDIRIYNYKVQRSRDRGGSSMMPRLLQLGGTGYIILELVNTAYRKESLSDNKKLTGLGVAALVAAAGFFWQHQKQKALVSGKNYRVEYIQMGSIKK